MTTPAPDGHAPCPHCGGRGWLPLSDDETLTEACDCADAPPPTHLHDPHWVFLLAGLSGNLLVAEAAWQQMKEAC